MSNKTQSVWRELKTDMTKALVVLALFIASLSASSFSAYSMDQDSFLNGGLPVIFCGTPVGEEHDGRSCGLCTIGAYAFDLPQVHTVVAAVEFLPAKVKPSVQIVEDLPSPPHRYFGRAPPVFA